MPPSRNFHRSWHWRSSFTSPYSVRGGINQPRTTTSSDSQRALNSTASLSSSPYNVVSAHDHQGLSTIFPPTPPPSQESAGENRNKRLHDDSLPSRKYHSNQSGYLQGETQAQYQHDGGKPQLFDGEGKSGGFWSPSPSPLAPSQEESEEEEIYHYQFPTPSPHVLSQEESAKDEGHSAASSIVPPKVGDAFKTLMDSKTVRQDLEAHSLPTKDADEQSLVTEYGDQYVAQQRRESHLVPMKMRKMSLLDNMSASTRERLASYVTKVFESIQDIKHDSNRCWLRPNTNKEGRVRTAISWRDRESFGTTRLQSITVEFGVVIKLLNESMSPAERQGWINEESHHLSHLCGNASCCNPKHHIIEAGAINFNRKNCHNRRFGGPKAAYVVCRHEPPCLYRTEAGIEYQPKTALGEMKEIKQFRQSTLSFSATKSSKTANPSEPTISLDSSSQFKSKADGGKTSPLDKPIELQRCSWAKADFCDLQQVHSDIRKMSLAELDTFRRLVQREQRALSPSDKLEVEMSIFKRKVELWN
ncbi:hypothetical protein IWX49DRAFT_550533 [Phyllosticta citricarpa]|uniref:Zinc-binding loop region of homing endonuclease domain-containing protein n=1 Tax=Phyllosticta citricarpa TaxID=55181 RepID=A0ABR1MJM8_9PEZI